MKTNLETISLIKSTFYGEHEIKRRLADFIMSSTRLSMGEQCSTFEDAFSSFQGRNFTALYNSGSSANLALIQALLNLGHLNRGDKVAFSAVTWSTNVMPLMQLGLVPIPVDIERETLNVGSGNLLATLRQQPDIKAFFISHILGFCSDLESIAAICDSRGILLLEDNCESFGSIYQGRKLGNFGFASTFSTYVGHHLSTIEGGMVCTNDQQLYEMLKIVRAHGWDRSSTPEVQNQLRERFQVDSFYDLYTFYDLGFNLRPTEITGFLGLLQMEVAQTIIDKRESNFGRFYNAAIGNPHILPFKCDHLDVISNFAYPVICRGVDDFIKCREAFKKNGIEIRPIVGGNMARQPFFSKYNDSTWNLPEADFIHNHGFYFPNNPELTEEEIDRITSLLLTVL